MLQISPRGYHNNPAKTIRNARTGKHPTQTNNKTNCGIIPLKKLHTEQNFVILSVVITLHPRISLKYSMFLWIVIFHSLLPPRFVLILGRLQTAMIWKRSHSCKSVSFYNITMPISQLRSMKHILAKHSSQFLLKQMAKSTLSSGSSRPILQSTKWYETARVPKSQDYPMTSYQHGLYPISREIKMEYFVIFS